MYTAKTRRRVAVIEDMQDDESTQASVQQDWSEYDSPLTDAEQQSVPSTTVEEPDRTTVPSLPYSSPGSSEHSIAPEPTYQAPPSNPLSVAHRSRPIPMPSTMSGAFHSTPIPPQEKRLGQNHPQATHDLSRSSEPYPTIHPMVPLEYHRGPTEQWYQQAMTPNTGSEYEQWDQGFNVVDWTNFNFQPQFDGVMMSQCTPAPYHTDVSLQYNLYIEKLLTSIARAQVSRQALQIET